VYSGGVVYNSGVISNVVHSSGVVYCDVEEIAVSEDNYPDEFNDIVAVQDDYSMEECSVQQCISIEFCVMGRK